MRRIICLATLVMFLYAAVAVAAEQNSAEQNSDEEGFVCLFDGKTLEGWQGAVDGYQVENGTLVCIPEKGGNLFTKDEYGDFVLHFEFQLMAGANNGLGIRTPLEGISAYEGMELQILDNSSSEYADLKPYQFHGSIYGVVPAKRGHLKPVGQWNQQEVICQGSQVTVILNGTTIVDANIAEEAKNGALDGRPHPGLNRTSGHIGFLGHGTRVAFRKIRIKPLP